MRRFVFVSLLFQVNVLSNDITERFLQGYFSLEYVPKYYLGK